MGAFLPARGPKLLAIVAGLQDAATARTDSILDDATALRKAASWQRNCPSCAGGRRGEGRADLDALAAYLEDRSYVLDDWPTTAETAVFGLVAPMLYWTMDTPVFGLCTRTSCNHSILRAYAAAVLRKARGR